MGGSIGRSTRSRFVALSQLNDTTDFEDNHIGKIGQNDRSMGTLGSDLARVDQVKILESSLSKGNHVVVQIAAPTENLIPKVRNGRVLPMSITGSGAGKGQGISTGVSKKGVRSKKKDPRSVTRFSLVGLVDNLSTELEKSQSDIVQHGTSMSASLHGDADEVQW
ncbi:hypothetical protein V6N11_084329 [Hibiscus sabdariffa]|uniref:Uncharacterized protein n=1 Tax=Hibiscus sabdariffa TaxID=183260 RepID=A0ABR2QT74_9ROSI